MTLSATASDSDGTISKVEFYNGTTLLGTDTTSPYSYHMVIGRGRHVQREGGGLRQQRGQHVVGDEHDHGQYADDHPPTGVTFTASPITRRW